MAAEIALQNINWIAGTVTVIPNAEAKAVLGIDTAVVSFDFDSLPSLINMMRDCIAKGVRVYEG